MSKILLKQATAMCPERFMQGDILIEDQRIAKIAPEISASADMKVIDCKGLLVLPGLIDAHVHFRQPGMEHKATIASESQAAALGGVTSYMEMPNTMPPTTTLEALHNKQAIAQKDSLVNYAFYLGASDDNLEQIKRVDPSEIAGIKIYMGSTTGNLLLDNESLLYKTFEAAPCIIATHCEDNSIVNTNTSNAKNMYGEHIPFSMHPIIRSRDCCLKSSKLAIELAVATKAKLHIMHLSCKEEVDLLAQYAVGSIAERQISAEVCIPHLYFNESNYEQLKGRLKCNPAVKYERDRLALLNGIKQGVITTIGTDHAPHEMAVKDSLDYLKVASGLPSVQFSLNVLFDLYKRGEASLEKLIRSATVNVAQRFGVVDRGEVKEGFFADFAIIDPQSRHLVSADDVASLCKWSPFVGQHFNASVVHTIASGRLVVENSKICATSGEAVALRFDHK